MNGDFVKTLTDHLPSRRRLVRGLLISVVLWVLFLVVTAYTSATTLLNRVGASDVMRAASGGIWQGKIAGEMVAFLATVVLLHLFFAVVTWVLACASSVISANFRQEKFGRMVVGWFSVLAGAALAFNALWYPRTLIGAYYHNLLETRVGPWPVGQLVYWLAFALCAFILVRAAAVLLRAADPGTRRRSLWVGSAVALLFVVVALLPTVRLGFASPVNADRPNIILLGIDSLRLEQLQRFGGTGITPNLDHFLATADLFPDATTPAARTFSSWVAILSGRPPTVTGARFNLAERSSVRANPTLGDVLRKAGYRTIYSTDEVRFANFDESYGFDQVVTPRIGASDFIVGTYNELPLSSLVVNTRIGKWLFPFSYANRGVATMFQPETYLERLRREVSFDGPTFFIAHLTAAHWPYYTSEVPFGVSTPTPGNERPVYRIGLQTADRMFGELVEMLERKGALRNALVIVLSDHGEALSLPSDSFFDATFHVDGLRAPIKMLDYGHGQSVLSKSQYQVLLSFRTFGRAQNLGVAGRSFPFLCTVEDIAPTILDYLKVDGNPLAAEGRSLLPFLEARETIDPAAPERIRFTETDLAVLPAPGGGVDEVGTARENAKFFMVDPQTARMHIKPENEPLATRYKERAAFTKNQLLAALPAGPYAHQYIFFDFSKSHGHLLLERPNETEPDAQRLWDAMARHYKGELMKPVAITPADWDRIGTEWENFVGEQADRRPAKSVAGPGPG